MKNVVRSIVDLFISLSLQPNSGTSQSMLEGSACQKHNPRNFTEKVIAFELHPTDASSPHPLPTRPALPPMSNRSLLAFVVQSGELGTSDTTHRLQTTHWLWTSEPQVFPYEYPEFGLHGREAVSIAGTHRSHYSCCRRHRRHLDLPLAHLRGVRRRPVRTRYCGQLQHQHSGDRPHRAHCVPPARPVALQRKRIGRRSAGAAVLHTHLHYTQNMMENNSILLLTPHRILISIRMAAHRQPPRSFHRLLGAGLTC